MFRDQIKELHDSGIQIRDGFALQAVLNQAYDMSYGLFNYDAAEVHPLTSVAMHPGEQLHHKTPRQLLFLRYRAAQVFKHTGIPFDQFIHRPPYQVEEMLFMCAEAEKEDVNIATNAMNNAANGQGSIKK